jgi:hypothetical protein
MESFYSSLKSESAITNKPSIHFLGDKGYVFYIPPFCGISKEQLRSNPTLFEGKKDSDFPCHVLVTDSGKYEILEAEEGEIDVGQPISAILTTFFKRRPFIKLRNDIASSRSVIERVIGRMKTIFPFISGTIYRTQINFLAAFLIVAVGVINKILESNPTLFLQDIGVEERDDQKVDELKDLFNKL